MDSWTVFNRQWDSQRAAMEDKTKFIRPLAHLLALGKLDSRVVLPALEQLADASAGEVSLPQLMEQLGQDATPEMTLLVSHLAATRCREADRAYQQKRSGCLKPSEFHSTIGDLPLDAPVGWFTSNEVEACIRQGLTTAQESAFSVNEACRKSAEKACNAFLTWGRISLIELVDVFAAKGGEQRVCEELRDRVLAMQSEMTDRIRTALSATPTQPLPSEGVDERLLLGELESAFAQASTLEQKQALVDQLCTRPSQLSARAIQSLVCDSPLQERASLILTLRFGAIETDKGKIFQAPWSRWLDWLSFQRQPIFTESSLEKLVRTEAPGLLRLWYSYQPNPQPEVLQYLASQSPSFVPAGAVPPIIGTAAPPPAVPPSLPSLIAPAPVASAPPVMPAPEPEKPREPTVWEEHIQPFIAENWYIVAGIGMVIAGSSLLAYYTWDKHWLLRYTIMPALLAFFTWALAGAGSWIERKSKEFCGTAAILRGAAVALLPVNFMAIPLLASDEQVTQRLLAVGAMTIIYAGVFGFGLRRWCAAVHPGLGVLLGGTLLMLNGLVVLGPAVRLVGNLEGSSMWTAVGVGFYLGFIGLAAAVARFTRRVLTPEMAMGKIVPWFFGSTIAVTIIQVFIWVHGYMRHLPKVETYALMVIMAGWLILFVERRALELLAQGLAAEKPEGNATTTGTLDVRSYMQLHGGESFLGFALILLGVFMGAADPWVRIAAFVMAGVAWMYQAFSRQHPLHYWIALTLMSLGGASVGLLPSFPGEWFPALGVAMALLMGVAGWKIKQRVDLAGACLGMQVTLLALTTIVAPLTQWHYHTPPLATAACLLVVSVLFGWRAFKDQQLHWLHATMVVLALVLPYLGFVDLNARSLQGNTMVFGLAGLSFLWLAACRVRNTVLMHQARSTVLLLYGGLAVAAMLLRTLVEHPAPDAHWYFDYMDYLGPLLITVVLVITTYHTRSLVPAAMAVGIVVILFPELRANFKVSLPGIAWGTGLGSAITGLLLITGCFYLRQAAFLKSLGEGDKFLGKHPFPFRRHDYTLFTGPVMASAIFLILKTEVWNLFSNWSESGVHLKTAIALIITGVAWIVLAIYYRRFTQSRWLVHAGWIWGLIGVAFAHWDLSAHPHWSWPFLVMGVVLTVLFWICRYSLEARFPWVEALLTQPIRMVLLRGSMVLALGCMVDLFVGASPEQLEWLMAFVAAQLVWHALTSRERPLGMVLFFLVWTALLAWTAPGDRSLWERLSLPLSLTPTLWMIIAVQVIVAMLEWSRRTYERLEPLISPGFLVSSALATLIGLAALVDGAIDTSLTDVQLWLAGAALLLAARAQISGLNLLICLLLASVIAQRAELLALDSEASRFELLATPWRVVVVSLGMVLVTQAARWLNGRIPRLFAGAYAHPFLKAPSTAWVYRAAAILVGLGVAYHTIDSVLREQAVQLWASYLGVVAMVLIAVFWKRPRYFLFGGLLLVLANLHCVRVYLGDVLRGNGLSEPHLICLGVCFSLLQASVVRRCLRLEYLIAGLNQGCLLLACFILVLLSANYFTHPNLQEITLMRFAISGAMALLAGFYFRRAARHPGPGEQSYAALCEGFYHFGLVLALWCMALMIPIFREPALTLLALSVPEVFFYLQAEMGTRRNRAQARRYLTSATVLGFVLLGLYVFKSVFHLVLFPEIPAVTNHYHYNAPLIMVLGVILLRLRGLGGTMWLAFYGGLALMGGGYFLLTMAPDLSPFDHPVSGAWCAIVLAHFWMTVSYARSPLRTAIQRLAALKDEDWHALRRGWGYCLLFATQACAVWGLSDYRQDTFMVAPLIAGAASILIHQAVLRKSALYWVAGFIELALALHVDFLVPSYLDKDAIVWVLLGCWAVASIVRWIEPKWLTRENLSRAAVALGALIFLHILYHEPGSPTGLWAFAVASLLAAIHPLAGRNEVSSFERGVAWLLPWTPVWMVYFSQSPRELMGLTGALVAWPALVTLMTLFLIGVFARVFQVHWAANYFGRPRSHYFMFDESLGWMKENGDRVHTVLLWSCFILVSAAQVFHYEHAYAARELALVILMQGAMTASWYFEGKYRGTMAPYYLMQLCALAAFSAIRRQLMLTTTFWNYEYDVWTALVVSFVLTGAKNTFDLQPRNVRVPMMSSICVLPIAAMIWVLVHGLGSNMALLVVGMHSLTFAYLGKGVRESPYNIVSIAGFVAFVLLAFWTKLGLRTVHAYVIPVGVGILILTQLFRRRIPAQARNQIRLVTLLAMLGSAGYYALVDERHTLIFNLTLVILSLAAMGLGSFVRVRLYLVIGFGALVIDLMAIVVKVLIHIDRGPRMTAIGSLVLLVGAALVFGAIYHKTNKEQIDRRINRLRAVFGDWE